MIQLAFVALLTWFFPIAAMAQIADSPWQEYSSAIGQTKKLPAGLLEKSELELLVKTGEQLFSTKFTILEGAGRPGATQATVPTRARREKTKGFFRTTGPDSSACSSCHNDPVAGGAGDFVTNVFASDGFGDAVFDTIDPQFSNERGTNHIFGAGLIELLAREMTADLQKLRQQALVNARKTKNSARIELTSKGVSYGYLTAHKDGLVNLDEVEGIDSDLVIRPFSQKGVAISLRQFTINAINQHHGMQAAERFGKRWTNTDDFDGDEIKDELSSADISALVAWQATLKAPVIMKPEHEGWRAAANIGNKLFNEIGCASCHVKSLPLKSILFSDPGPLDTAGTLSNSQVENPAQYDLSLLDWSKSLKRNDKNEILVPLFGDLKRHNMSDPSMDLLGNELLSQNFVGRNMFITAELWGAGSSAPYGHRNDFTTLNEIILAHGGEARQSRQQYSAATKQQRSSIIAYLKTLVIKP